MEIYKVNKIWIYKCIKTQNSTHQDKQQHKTKVWNEENVLEILIEHISVLMAAKMT